MSHHLHDVARTVHNERLRGLANNGDDHLPRLDSNHTSLRSAIGNTLIRAGTRLTRRSADSRRIQTSPPC